MTNRNSSQEFARQETNSRIMLKEIYRSDFYQELLAGVKAFSSIPEMDLTIKAAGRFDDCQSLVGCISIESPKGLRRTDFPTDERMAILFHPAGGVTFAYLSRTGVFEKESDYDSIYKNYKAVHDAYLSCTMLARHVDFVPGDHEMIDKAKQIESAHNYLKFIERYLIQMLVLPASALGTVAAFIASRSEDGDGISALRAQETRQDATQPLAKHAKV